MTGLGPQKVTVMGVDLVVWHTEADEKKGETRAWTAQVDACAHRLAPLSQGRVDPETNCVECPYHGWQFDAGGNVTSVPQLEENKSIESVRKQGGNVRTFPVHAAGDLLFVFLPASLHGEMFPRSLLPEHYYPHVIDGDGPIFVRELPYSFDFLVENFMDPAHIPFAHHKLQSTREDGMPIEMAPLVSNFTHVEASFRDRSAKRDRDGYLSFQRPCYYHFGEYTGDGVDEATGKKARQPKLKIFIAPVRAGRCRIFMGAFPVPLPTVVLHAGSNRFLNSDVWLHEAEREVVRRKEAGLAAGKLAGMDYISASRSDAGVSLFRRWWDQHGMAGAPPHTFGMATMEQLGPAPLSRREQIDPWVNHARHCASCRRGLRRIKRLRAACTFLALASAAAAGRRHPVVGLAGVGASLYGRNFFKKFATAIEGNPEASGIADRSTAASAD